MKDNKNRRPDDERIEEHRIDDDGQARENTTMNEMIRDVNGDPDMDLNKLKENTSVGRSSNDRPDSYSAESSDLTGGVNYNPNDASMQRSGGFADMDNQTDRGAGENTGGRLGSGSNLAPKRGVTGSDFDGQNKTS